MTVHTDQRASVAQLVGAFQGNIQWDPVVSYLDGGACPPDLQGIVGEAVQQCNSGRDTTTVNGMCDLAHYLAAGGGPPTPLHKCRGMMCAKPLTVRSLGWG